MKVNRYWKIKNGCYELHFIKYEIDEVVLKFVPDKNDNGLYWYVSEDLKVEADCERYDSIEEAKENFELLYEQYLEGQINFYEELLEQWDEEGNVDTRS